MTMAVADWLLKDPTHGMDTLEASFISFAKKYPCPMGGYGGGFNRWLFSPETLGDYGNHGVKLGERHPYNSFGNGSAMRASANGWMFDTLEEAMVAFFDSTDFESAIRLAVSLGGDSDTLACITGGIAEAFYKEIPDEIALFEWNLLPEDFKVILKKMETKSSYRLPKTIIFAKNN